MVAALLLLLASAPAPQEPAPVDLARLLDECADLARLARLPEESYDLVQFSSYDRRSVAPGEAGWFSNADGFGGEPLPGFEAVVREPGADGVGEYLLCDVRGPGAVVRGWSAGMGGTLRAWIDGAEESFFTGSAYDFLARRSRVWAERQGLALEVGDAFVQQDADYFPVPFAERLRVTWEGTLGELHFYHLEVRRYAEGTAVRSFDEGGLPALAPRIAAAAARLTGLGTGTGADDPLGTGEEPLTLLLAEGAEDPSFEWVGGSAALTGLAFRLRTGDLSAALRGVLLRLDFDDAGAEVEVPLGDFFGTFSGLHPGRTLPLEVRPDGWLICRFVMPFARRAELSLLNRSGGPVAVQLAAHTEPWTWDERSLHFRADWRQGPAVVLEDNAPVDLAFLRARGEGRLVGVASLLVNPSRIATPGGNWWGEGDEKVFVDGAPFPALFGTGSEDYYNYSWSRPDLFDHPYCAQPVDSGPGTAGYVVNTRFHVLDDLRFRRGIDFFMELWPHRQDFPTTYARLAWWYARPGASADTPPIADADLVVAPLPRWEPDAAGGMRDSEIEHFEDLEHLPDGCALDPEPLASRGRVLDWDAAPGHRFAVPWPVEEAGRFRPNLVVRLRQDAGAIRLLVDGEPLRLTDAGGGGMATGGEVVPLRPEHAVTRLISLGWEEVELDAGMHVLEVERVEAGGVAFDYLWLKRTGWPPVWIEGAVEAETARAVGDAAGGWQVQGMERGWSGGRHLWVRAQAPGQGVTLDLPVPAPGRYRVLAHLTKSWDYGVLELAVDGEVAATGVDTWAERIEQLPPVDLGVHELGARCAVRFAVTGSNPASRAPHHYFGIDCVVLEPVGAP